jgi:putative SOS response-associated peptidase YedK
MEDRAPGEVLESCTIIITEPNDFVDIHDRMPVLATPDQLTPWLRGEAGTEMLKPAPNHYLQRLPVSLRIHSSGLMRTIQR